MLLLIIRFVIQRAIKKYRICSQTRLEAVLNPHLNYWIGLTDLDVEGTFVWQSNSEQANYTYWAEGEPNNAPNQDHCAHLVIYGIDIFVTYA